MSQTIALFIKVNDEWRFEGFVRNESSLAALVRVIEKDIKATKNTDCVTETYKIVTLP